MLSSLTLSTLNEMSAYYSIVYTPFRRLLVKLDHFSGFVYIRHEAWTTVVPAPAMSVCLSSGERPAPSVTRKGSDSDLSVTICCLVLEDPCVAGFFRNIVAAIFRDILRYSAIFCDILRY